jgi:hypothetical protein
MRQFAVTLAVALVSAGCAHSQRPERKVYVISDDASSVGSDDARGTGGSGSEAYCNEVQKQCFNQCWSQKPDVQSIKKHSEKHIEHCTTKCLETFMRCIKEQEELERQALQNEQLQFSNMDDALGWLKHHAVEVPSGTNVVVAGVAFVVAIVAGALVLSPL